MSLRARRVTAAFRSREGPLVRRLETDGLLNDGRHRHAILQRRLEPPAAHRLHRGAVEIAIAAADHDLDVGRYAVRADLDKRLRQTMAAIRDPMLDDGQQQC